MIIPAANKSTIPHPPWYKIYSSLTDVGWLTNVILGQAANFSAAARRDRQLKEADRQVDLLRFKTVDNNDDDDDSVMSCDSVELDAAFSNHLNNATRRLCRTAQLRPKQILAVQKILLDPQTNGKLIVVDRTGGGKSMILFLTAVMIAGITLVFIPLLTLTPDQLARFRKKVQKYGTLSQEG